MRGMSGRYCITASRAPAGSFCGGSTNLRIRSMWCWTGTIRDIRWWKDGRVRWRLIKFLKMDRQKIVIAGGSGFLGHSLLKKYAGTEVEIVVLTRKAFPGSDYRNVRYVHWDAASPGGWMAELEGSTAVINLVGRSVNCRYTERNKEEIIASRVNATRIIGYAIAKAARPPRVWINAGSAAIFGDGGEEQKDEGSLAGEGFSPEVCKKWEAAFYSIDTPFTRKVVLRMGLVFQK